VRKELIGPALQVHVLFGIEDQRRTGDLLRDAVAKVEQEHLRNDSVGRGLTHHEPCLVSTPSCAGRTIESLLNLAVEFGSVFLLDDSDEAWPLMRRNGGQLSDAEIVDSVVGDNG
jgi:hypothetical protein